MPKPIARATDAHVCPLSTHLGGGPVTVAAPMRTTAGTPGMNAARLGDYAMCMFTPDVLFQGASTVLLGGLPVCGMGDQTAHGGTILIGSSSVLVGGPTFLLPPSIKVVGPSDFCNKTIRDLYFLSTTEAGRQILARLTKSGKPVLIMPCSDPGNSYTFSSDDNEAMGGKGAGSVVHYNPDVAIYAWDPSGKMIDEPPQVVLAHELIHAVHNAEGTMPDGPDPSPPPKDPEIDEAEAKAIGVGSYASKSHPTENDLRKELGLPPRADHQGGPVDWPKGNLRPGGY